MCSCRPVDVHSVTASLSLLEQTATNTLFVIVDTCRLSYTVEAIINPVRRAVSLVPLNRCWHGGEYFAVRPFRPLADHYDLPECHCCHCAAARPDSHYRLSQSRPSVITGSDGNNFMSQSSLRCTVGFCADRVVALAATVDCRFRRLNYRVAARYRLFV